MAVAMELPTEARAFLDPLAGPESRTGRGPGGPYNKLFGGGFFHDYSHHPWSGGGAPGGHSDAGRYQDLASTWRRIQQATSLKDFSPHSQDVGNWWLAQQDYRTNTHRDLLSDLKSGHFNAAGLAHTWVSIGNLGSSTWMRKFFNPAMQRAMAAGHEHAGGQTAPEAIHSHVNRALFGHPHVARHHVDILPSLPTPELGIDRNIPSASRAGSPFSTHPVGAPPREQQHNKQSHVYLDGRIIGEIVERHITKRHLHTHGPGGHDGRRGLTPVDSWSVA